MKEVTVDERKRIQLQMLMEIDEFCRKNNIRYTLAYGTLIGAIRHQGFIPWDDDVDIMMPLPDMLRFKESFKSNNMLYVDVDTDDMYQYAFSRIVHKGTYTKQGVMYSLGGVCIDLYPILGLPSSLDEVNDFLKQASNELTKRMRFIRLMNFIRRFLPIRTIPGFHKAMKRYRDFLFQFPYEGTRYYFTNGGELEMRNVYDFDLFQNIIDVPFEGHVFNAVSCYDHHLRHFYGDYMQLPPEDKRVPYHGDQYYWK